MALGISSTGLSLLTEGNLTAQRSAGVYRPPPHSAMSYRPPAVLTNFHMGLGI